MRKLKDIHLERKIEAISQINIFVKISSLKQKKLYIFLKMCMCVYFVCVEIFEVFYIKN